jgi:hypothetical protein
MKNKTSKIATGSRIIDIQDQDYWMDRKPYHNWMLMNVHYEGCANIEGQQIMDLCKKISRLEDVIRQLKAKARTTEDNIFILGNIIIVQDRIKELSIQAKKHDRKLQNYMDRLQKQLDNEPQPPVFEINFN